MIAGGRPLATIVTFPVPGSTRETRPAAGSVTYKAPPGPDGAARTTFQPADERGHGRRVRMVTRRQDSAGSNGESDHQEVSRGHGSLRFDPVQGQTQSIAGMGLSPGPSVAAIVAAARARNK